MVTEMAFLVIVRPNQQTHPPCMLVQKNQNFLMGILHFRLFWAFKFSCKFTIFFWYIQQRMKTDLRGMLTSVNMLSSPPAGEYIKVAQPHLLLHSSHKSAMNRFDIFSTLWLQPHISPSHKYSSPEMASNLKTRFWKLRKTSFVSATWSSFFSVAW